MVNFKLEVPSGTADAQQGFSPAQSSRAAQKQVPPRGLKPLVGMTNQNHLL